MAECDDDEGIGLGIVDLIYDFGVVYGFGFDDGDFGDVVVRRDCDGGWCEFATSACWSVGLGDDGGEVVGIGVGSEELEGGEAERAGAEVGDFEW